MPTRYKRRIKLLSITEITRKIAGKIAGLPQLEMKMNKNAWSTIQKIPEWIVITPAKDPDMNDEWVLRREAEKRIEKLEAREPLCRCADEVRCDYLKRIEEMETELKQERKDFREAWSKYKELEEELKKHKSLSDQQYHRMLHKYERCFERYSRLVDGLQKLHDEIFTMNIVQIRVQIRTLLEDEDG